MSMPCDCGKESPPEKKLKLEAEGDGSDLKVGMEIKTGMKNLPAVIPMIGLLGQIRTPLSTTLYMTKSAP
ncbi:hypothetical protein KY289_037047 [Solanum tuberosum]|nr:hypothetical protein KY289_037047 [Solanum tuberosum]